MMSDVRCQGKGVRALGRGEVWTVVHSGRVAIAQDPELRKRWRTNSGRRVWSDTSQIMRVDLSRLGWTRGLSLQAVYMPTSETKQKELRGEECDGVSDMMEGTPATAMLMVAGDLNAETGAGRDWVWRDVLGPHEGAAKRAWGCWSSVGRKG